MPATETRRPAPKRSCPRTEPHEGCGYPLRGAPLNDNQALDQIMEILRDPAWGVGMLEDIRELVDRSGRCCGSYPEDPDDPEAQSAWGRH